MDRRARYAIDRAIAGLSGDRDGRHYVDLEGPAVYRIEPPGAECMVLACLRCRQVTVKPGAPRLAELVVTCNGCGARWRLHPPAEVVAFGRLGILATHGRLS